MGTGRPPPGGRLGVTPGCLHCYFHVFNNAFVVVSSGNKARMGLWRKRDGVNVGGQVRWDTERRAGLGELYPGRGHQGTARWEPRLGFSLVGRAISLHSCFPN